MPNDQTTPSPIGLYRSGITTPEQLQHVTVGREHFMEDIRNKLFNSMDKASKQHSLFIGPRGAGKTHLLSLIAQGIQDTAELNDRYIVVRFPEEPLRLLSYVDFLLGICEILQDSLPPKQASVWEKLYRQLVEEPDSDRIRDILEAEIKKSIRDKGKTLLIMLENFDEILTKQIKGKQDAAAMRKLFMGDNGCMLLATAPLYFSAVSDVNQPFYDFFDVQLLANLSEEQTLEMIRLNLEWDKRQELINSFSDLQPKILALHQMTGGNPRLTMMLYELIANDSIISARDQFMRLLDRITPFYQDRIKEIPPQERAILETMAKMRSTIKTPAAIAARMRMSQQQTSTLLKRLTKSNYLKVMPNSADKRSRIYVIREGFFDLWLAMNLSRAEYARLPFLVEFFEKWYRSLDEREEKRRSLHELLKQSERRDEAAAALDYLSEIGTAEEKASAKAALAKALSEQGVRERAADYIVELQRMELDGLGGWIVDHASQWASDSTDIYADLEQMIQCWKTQRSGDLEAFARKLHEMGGALNYKNYSEAKIEFIEESLIYLKDSDERIGLRLDLAGLFSEAGKWHLAEKYLTEALQEAETHKSTNYLSIVLSNLSALYFNLARYQQAEPLIRRALEINEKNFGSNHPVTARILNNLAQLLQATNQLSKAEPLMRHVLEIDEKTLGIDHPITAESLNNLAVLLQKTNRKEKAEPLLRRSLEIGEKSFGSDHPTVAILLNNLAQILQDTNRFKEAELLMRRALEIDKKSFASDHPNIARDLNNLSQLLQHSNRLEDAKPLIEEVLSILHRFNQSTGDTHPHMGTATKNYVKLLEEMGYDEEQIKQRLDEILNTDDT